jgi:hypothetical protein
MDWFERVLLAVLLWGVGIPLIFRVRSRDREESKLLIKNWHLPPDQEGLYLEDVLALLAVLLVVGGLFVLIAPVLVGSGT